MAKPLPGKKSTKPTPTPKPKSPKPKKVNPPKPEFKPKAKKPSKANPKSPIHIEEFIEEQYSLFNKFVIWWREENKQTPEHFPLLMRPGDWDDQFMHFLILENEE